MEVDDVHLSLRTGSSDWKFRVRMGKMPWLMSKLKHNLMSQLETEQRDQMHVINRNILFSILRKILNISVAVFLPLFRDWAMLQNVDPITVIQQ